MLFGTGNFGIGDSTPSYSLDVNGDCRVGWHGDSTRIKILPSDFRGNDDDAAAINAGWIAYEDDDAARGVRPRNAVIEVYAFVSIPMGYKATHVMVYGLDTDTVTVYESDIDDGNWGSSLGSAATGTEINITDVDDSTTNFLVIHVATDATTDDLYGGYVTIAPQ